VLFDRTHRRTRPAPGGGAARGPAGRRGPPLSRAGSRGGAHRPSAAPGRHALARPRNRRRPVAGRAARQPAGARALLGHGLRLAPRGGEAQRAPAVRHEDRRRGHPLHPRQIAPPRRDAADRHARLAGLRVRADQAHRAAHRSHALRRAGGGRVPRGDPVAARLRLLGAAGGGGVGVGPHRPRVGRADEAPRLHPLRRAGRRLGRERRPGDGAAGAGGAGRHPHQLPRHGAGRRGRRARRGRAAAGRAHRAGARRLRGAQEVRHGGKPRVPDDDVRPAAGGGLRDDGFARRPRRVPPRAPRVRAVVLWPRPRAVAHARRRAGQPVALLADEHRRLRRAHLLGEPGGEPDQRGVAQDGRDQGAGRRLRLPAGDLPRARDMDAARLSHAELLQPGRARRALRGVGAPGRVRRGAAGGVQAAAHAQRRAV
ncbi:MAG: Epoxide hydrolase, partial [uncultured Gemmatimonadetes bacterium]